MIISGESREEFTETEQKSRKRQVRLGDAQSPVIGSSGREETASASRADEPALASFSCSSDQVLHKCQTEMRRSKHVIMKKEGASLVHVRGLTVEHCSSQVTFGKLALHNTSHL